MARQSDAVYRKWLNPGTLASHRCTVYHSSNSCLPKLHPKHGRFARWMRQFRKLFLVSEFNPETSLYFRSHAAVVFERRRHVRLFKAYIIHPLSLFNVYWDILMMLLWLATFVCKPLRWMVHDLSKYYFALMVFTDFIFVCDMGLRFITGYVIEKNKEVILDNHYILMHYLKTYFFVDLISNFPFNTCVMIYTDCCIKCYVVNVVQETVRFIRMRTVLNYMVRITEFFNYTEFTYQVLCLAVTCCYYMHWWACWVYAIQRLVKIYDSSLITWNDYAGIDKDSPLSKKYLHCVMQAMCMFFRAGIGMYPTTTAEMQLFATVMLIFGGIYFAYMVVIFSRILNLVRPETKKYDDAIEGLKVFIEEKRLPPNLRTKLLAFYERSFEKKFFREKAILSTVSEHLKYEIMLHNCRNILYQSDIFEGLPKPLLAILIRHMKEELFLANDLILQAGEPSELMYFIDHGTIAVYALSGQELFHLRDGQCFGELTIFLDSPRLVNVVAVESTHVFYLSAKEIRQCFAPYPDLYEQVIQKARIRYNRLCRYYDAKASHVQLKELYNDDENT